MRKTLPILLITCLAFLYACGDGPECELSPYELTHVVITPENPTFADTVRVEVKGSGRVGCDGELGSEELIKMYSWGIGSTSFNTDESYTEVVNNVQADTINGRVWGNFDHELYPFPVTWTGTIRFQIIYEENGDSNE